MAIRKARTKQGVCVGTDSKNGLCTVFKGVPYAAPPTGELRFASPRPAPAWEGERACDQFAKGPVQSGMREEPVDTSLYDEDCLYLNIWTDADSQDEKRPVLVWFHGGGFSTGAAWDPVFDGEAFASAGAILVTAGVRVGVMGYFCLPEFSDRGDDASYGNYGLQDCIASLKWIQENIAAFGGDPGRVTIFGQSSGGMTCRMLLVSPLARGLFRRVIIQSGGSLDEADLVRPHEELSDISRRSMESAGLTLEDVLHGDAHTLQVKLSEAARQFAPEEVAVFQPCVDHHVLPDVPSVLVAQGKYDESIDIIMGTVSGDGWMFSRKIRSQILDRTDLLKAFAYAPGITWGQHQTETGRRPIYTYFFERTQKEQRPARDGSYNGNAPHSSELPYIFGTLEVKGIDDPFDKELSRQMMEYWLHFARTGDPNGAGLTRWEPYTAEHPCALHFTDDGTVFEAIGDNDASRRIVRYTIEHPGMLTDLTGFFD